MKFPLAASDVHTAEGTQGTTRSKRTKSSCRRAMVLLFAVLSVVGSSATAQQLLDRVVARVGTSAITQTDVDAAIAFGIVEQKDAEGRDPLKQLIDRRLILAEVARFPPPEPAEAEIKTLMESMRAAAGANVAAVMKRTGVDDDRLSEIARDTLRMRSYLQQRFGSGGARSDQQRTRWLTELRNRGDVTEITARP